MVRWACGLVVAVACVAGVARGELLVNGGFESVKDGKPAGWSLDASGKVLEENGNRFVRLVSEGPEQMPKVFQKVAVPKGTRGLLFSGRVRFEDVEVGAEKYHDARFILHLKDEKGAKAWGKLPIPAFKGSSKGEWVKFEYGFVVAPDAAVLEVMGCHFKTAKGTFDLDDVSVKVIAAEEVEFVGFERSKPLPVFKEYVSKELVVKGNRLVTKAGGQEVWLQGLAVPSMEWLPQGEHIMESVTNAVTDWNANVVRLALGSKFWFGRGPWQHDGGEKCRALVDAVVDYVQRQGKYVVLDLHEYRAVEPKHVSFWVDVATRYGNHPGVIFGLLNEPHGIDWEVWRNGGWVTDKPKKKPGVAMEDVTPLRAFYAVGEQELVERIRKLGARNILSIGALDFAYRLEGVLEGFALQDSRDGNGIMYETHVYPWKRGWQKAFLDVAEKYPILVGECGAQPKAMPFENESRERPATWVPDFLGCIQKYKLNWTGWSFHPSAGPCILKDWTYAPTDYWGAFVKDALHGKQFEMKKMR